MDGDENSRARAVADLAEGLILATVEIGAPPERVFGALASEEIVDWWVQPGVLDTREWAGDLRVGGHWRASGTFEGEPWVLEGEFLEVDRPHHLMHTFGVGTPWGPTTVTYRLEGIDGGTRVTFRQAGFTSREQCAGFQLGWESSFQRLGERLAAKL